MLLVGGSRSNWGLSDLHWNSPRATAKAKHLAGFMPAPGYPGASPTVANAMSPSVQAVRNGPSFGPNSSPCLGSKPTPNARKLVEVKRHVKRELVDAYRRMKLDIASIKNIWPSEIALCSK